jgi:hypothetical protein
MDTTSLGVFGARRLLEEILIYLCQCHRRTRKSSVPCRAGKVKARKETEALLLARYFGENRKEIPPAACGAALGRVPRRKRQSSMGQ